MSRKMRLISCLVFALFVGLPIWLSQFRPAFRKWRGRENASETGFLISTDRGIFILSEPYTATDLERLLTGHTFGVARGSNGELFLSIDALGFCYVLLVDPRPWIPKFPKVLISQRLDSKASRIHQLDIFQGVLYVASTMTNSVIAIDASLHQVLDEFPCVEDIAGRPIRGDHNHVNSVYALADSCLFMLHTWTEETSAIGIKTKQGISLYELGPVGSHDLVVAQSGIVWSDSFGKGHGTAARDSVATVQRLELSGSLAKFRPPTYFVRGIASNKLMSVVGGSHNAKRSERFSGQAELFLYEARDPLPSAQVAARLLKCPFSQVYQICTESGMRSWDECRETKATVLTEILEKNLGPPVMVCPTRSVGNSQ